MFNVEDLDGIDESKESHEPEIITGNILEFFFWPIIILYTQAHIFTKMLSTIHVVLQLVFQLK